MQLRLAQEVGVAKSCWGESPSTETLSYGVSIDDFNDINESDETVPDTVPNIVSDDADIEEHTKSSASQSHGDKSFTQGDRPRSSSSGGDKGCTGKKGPLPTLCKN